MSTDDMVTYRDPDLPGMAFGRPPTRPGGSRHAADQKVEPGPGDGGIAPGDGPGGRSPDEGAAPVADDGSAAVVDRDPEVDDRAATPALAPPDAEPFLGADQIAGLRRRWDTVQAGFVDDPRQAVEVADDIVAETVGALHAAIDDRRRELAEPWRDHADASTDALLVAFQSYRSVFERVLSS